MARKKRRASRKRSTPGAGATGRRRGRPTALASVPTADLQRELERRMSDMSQRRDELLSELDSIDRMMTGERRGPGRPRRKAGRRGRPGRPKGAGRRRGRPPKSAAMKTRGRKRPRNKMNLVEALAAVLKGRTMGVTEVADAVKKSGYKTTSPNFRTIVNQALLKHKSVFDKVGRGQYTAK